MLLDIKNFFQAKPVANLMELSRHFKQPPDNMRIMLEHWQRKGRLQLVPKPGACGTSCINCEDQFAEIYRWHV
ncbi:MAG: FeoC-like transcriptional regulator [Gammaproteobacteria bacterium]|nr:FeoC-like transcriptional regulator [Gammaproteobacteria bacterium]